MSLVIFVLLVLIILALALWAVDQIPPLQNPPINWIVRVVIIFIAILFLVQRAGLG